MFAENIRLLLVTLGVLLPIINGQCAAGSYIAPDGVCRTCPAIFAQPQANQAGCIPCPANSLTSEDGLTVCRTCTNGKAPSSGSSQCLCPVGTQLGSESGNCERCATGSRWLRARFTAVDGGDPGRCSSCAANAVNPDVVRNGICIPCAPNEISNEDGTACVECAQGQFGTSDGCVSCAPGTSGTPCRNCSTGSFRSGNDGSRCVPCPRNGFAMEGSSSCVICDEGTAAFADGTCGTCPPGTHYEESSFSCVECGEMQFMDVPNIRSSCYECATTAFSERGATECISCAAGQFGGVIRIQTSDSVRFGRGCRNIECERGQFFDPTPTVLTSERCL